MTEQWEQKVIFNYSPVLFTEHLKALRQYQNTTFRNMKKLEKLILTGKLIGSRTEFVVRIGLEMDFLFLSTEFLFGQWDHFLEFSHTSLGDDSNRIQDLKASACEKWDLICRRLSKSDITSDTWFLVLIWMNPWWFPPCQQPCHLLEIVDRLLHSTFHRILQEKWEPHCLVTSRWSQFGFSCAVENRNKVWSENTILLLVQEKQIIFWWCKVEIFDFRHCQTAWLRQCTPPRVTATKIFNQSQLQTPSKQYQNCFCKIPDTWLVLRDKK